MMVSLNQPLGSLAFPAPLLKSTDGLYTVSTVLYVLSNLLSLS